MVNMRTKCKLAPKKNTLVSCVRGTYNEHTIIRIKVKWSERIYYGRVYE